MQALKKVKAFTLSEMTIVLIITSIVIGLAFSTLNLVQKHMQSIQQNFKERIELNSLEELLWLDFNRYSNIEYDVKTDVLIFATEMEEKKYLFIEDMIVKDTDTFNIRLKEKFLFFDGNKVNDGMVDAIKLITKKKHQERIKFIYKTNTANNFIR